MCFTPVMTIPHFSSYTKENVQVVVKVVAKKKKVIIKKNNLCYDAIS